MNVIWWPQGCFSSERSAFDALFAAGPSQGGERPLGGQRTTRSGGAWGHHFAAAGPSQGGERPLGGQRTTRSGGAWGHHFATVTSAGRSTRSAMV